MFLSNNVSNEIRFAACFNDCARPLSSPHGETLGFLLIQVNFNCGSFGELMKLKYFRGERGTNWED